MNLQIRPMADDDLEAVVHLSLLAWEPVFHSFKQVLGSEIYSLIYPDWRKSQSEVVTATCQDEKISVWVADVDSLVVGFVACTFDHDKEEGEVYMLAVHPDHQNRGIGTELNLFALERMKENGMKLVSVGTGGDPGHAPARRSYEKVGYTPLPIVRYYKAL
jgi:ribosomal protein S18 acetylase RimI-like enzyme